MGTVTGKNRQLADTVTFKLRLSVFQEGQFLEGGGKQEFMLVNTMDSPIAVKVW